MEGRSLAHEPRIAHFEGINTLGPRYSFIDYNIQERDAHNTAKIKELTKKIIELNAPRPSPSAALEQEFHARIEEVHDLSPYLNTAHMTYFIV